MNCSDKGHWKEIDITLIPLSEALKMFEDSENAFPIGKENEIIITLFY